MEGQSGKSKMAFHLFNCDRTFSLDIIAELLSAVRGSLPYTYSVEKHPFSLPQMRELSENVSTFEMDYAIFVVHAHESRLSINEENAGIGYAKLYKALLRATGLNNCTLLLLIFFYNSVNLGNRFHLSKRRSFSLKLRCLFESKRNRK